jgi:hypothetical protein
MKGTIHACKRPAVLGRATAMFLYAVLRCAVRRCPVWGCAAYIRHRWPSRMLGWTLLLLCLHNVLSATTAAIHAFKDKLSSCMLLMC